MKYTRHILFTVLATLIWLPANATERYHSSTLKFVYPLASGTS